MRIPLIDPKPETYKVDRIRKGQPNIIDKAVEKTDDDTEEKKLKFKSDGAVVPKPSADKIETSEQTSLWKKLQGKRYIKTLKFIDHGDESGEFVEVDFDDNELRSTGESRMFETHRSLRMQKISDMFSEEDNQKWWFLGTAGLLVAIMLGGMYIITNGFDQTIANAVQQGVKAGLHASGQAAQTAQQGAPGGG